jgi:hypothetical protein
MVIIIGHIDPRSCLAGFIQNYYKILNRYGSTIVSQYFGHFHTDFIELFYNLDINGTPLNRATIVSFIAPSVTSYQDADSSFYVLNPAYRLYTSFNTLSHKTMYLDLNDTITEYVLNSLLLIDLDNLVNQMLKNISSLLTEAFIKYLILSSLILGSFTYTLAYSKGITTNPHFKIKISVIQNVFSI